MKINIISIGKFDNKSQEVIFKEYIKRLKIKINLIEISVKHKKNASIDEIKKIEEKLILKNLKNNNYICCDENGSMFNSVEFSNKISLLIEKYNEISFIIGGAFGLTENIKNNSIYNISFSKMTFPHIFVRLIMAEQIYRAITIIEKHPYHKY